MMKKIFLALVILPLIIALMLSVKPMLSWSSNFFREFVVSQFNKEEKERQQRVENGEIVRGKDTVLIWENMYVIGHYYDSNHLNMEVNGVSNIILEKVKKHKVKKKKLYILSEEGYAIIDKSNICRVFVTIPKEDFVNGYSIDNEGIKHPISRFVNDKHVQYLSSYDNFAMEEKEVFEKME